MAIPHVHRSTGNGDPHSAAETRSFVGSFASHLNSPSDRRHCLHDRDNDDAATQTLAVDACRFCSSAISLRRGYAHIGEAAQALHFGAQGCRMTAWPDDHPLLQVNRCVRFWPIADIESRTLRPEWTCPDGQRRVLAGELQAVEFRTVRQAPATRKSLDR